MADPANFTPVTDNTLLPLGQQIDVPERGYSEAIDITPIFEGGLYAAPWTSRGQRFAGDLVELSVSSSLYLFRLTSDPDPNTSIYLNPRSQDRGINIMGSSAAISFDSDDPNSGLFLDLNEDRDSLVLTWRNFTLDREGLSTAPSTIQLEMIDIPGGVEYVVRYTDMNFAPEHTVRLFPR